MSRFKLLLLSGGLVVNAATVQAQVTGVVTGTSATLTTATSGNVATTVFNGPQIGGRDGNSEVSSGSLYESTSRVGTGVVEFQSGNASAGQYNYFSSHTSVDIAFTNDGPDPVTPALHSTLTPAGLGFFVGSLDCLNGLGGCGPGQSGVHTFQDFVPDTLREPLSDNIAGASFNFTIKSTDPNTNTTTVMYQLSGVASLVHDSTTGENKVVTDLTDAEVALTGFRLNSPLGSESEYGVAWDATGIDVDFPEGLILAHGESAVLTYETTVETFSRASCFGPIGFDDGCVIAYSSFGDPVGRRGSSTFAALLAAFEPEAAAGGIKFDTFAFNYPTFKDGVLTFTLANGDTGGGGGEGAVPEPASWAMMVAGFGLAGGMLRRRREDNGLKMA